MLYVSKGMRRLASGVCDVDARLFDRAEIEALRIDELDDKDAEKVVVAEALRREDLRQAAEQLAQRGRLRLRRMIGGEEFEDVVADGGIALVDDGVAAAV